MNATMNWYCDTYHCKMTRESCNKRKVVSAKKTFSNSVCKDAGCHKCKKGFDMTEEINKVCKKCLVLKPLSAFTLNKECKDGTEGACRDCKLASQRESDRKRRIAQRDDKTKFEAMKLELYNNPGSPTILDKDRFEKIGDKFRAAVGIENIKPYVVQGDDRGPKESTGKPDWSVFPFKEAESVVKVFEYGKDKYGAPFTYRKGIPSSELWAAIMRHAIAIQSGEDVDPESGCKHMAHIAANALMSLS